jgi:hypothetical protein
MKSLLRRIEVLEFEHSSSPNHHCDLDRRLARYMSYFEKAPWICIGAPERRAKREADLVRYKTYFDALENGQVLRWEQ